MWNEFAFQNCFWRSNGTNQYLETLTTDQSKSDSDSDSAVTEDSSDSAATDDSSDSAATEDASDSGDETSDDADSEDSAVSEDSASATAPSEDSDSDGSDDEISGESGESADSDEDESDNDSNSESDDSSIESTEDISGEDSDVDDDDNDTESSDGTDAPEDSESDDQDEDDDESVPDDAVAVETTSIVDMGEDDDTQSTTTSTTEAPTDRGMETEDICAGLSSSECGAQHDDDGNQLCAQNMETNACYEVVQSVGIHGRGGFDTGYEAARKTADLQQSHLYIIMGILGGILAVLAMIVICGGFYLFGGNWRRKPTRLERSFNRWSFSAARYDKKTMSVDGIEPVEVSHLETSHLTDMTSTEDGHGTMTGMMDSEGDTVPMITAHCSDDDEIVWNWFICDSV